MWRPSHPGPLEVGAWRTRHPQGAAGRAPAADQPENDPQRGAGRPLRSGQDDSRRGAARCDRYDPAPRSRRGRLDGQRLRRGRDAPAALGEPVARPVIHGGIKVNLLDTPGYADFVGDLRAGLRAADAALFVVSAVDGIDGADPDAVGGVRRGRHAARRRDHQDRPAARPTSTRSWPTCQDAFGEGVLPLLLPVRRGRG